MLEKSMLIDAIIGKGFKSMIYADNMTKLGLAEFCGNQWNPDWNWKRSELLKLDITQLQNIYSRVNT